MKEPWEQMPSVGRTVAIVKQALKEGFKVTRCEKCDVAGARIHSKVTKGSRCFSCGDYAEAAFAPKPRRKRQCQRCKKFYLTAALWNLCEKCREYREKHPLTAKK